MVFVYMNDTYVTVNSVKAWFLAARPKTLTGAAVPVMIGTAAAYGYYGSMIRVLPAVLCMLFALVMQIDANFVNDYFDFMKGTDDEQRLGPKRACAQGWITASAMRKGLFFTTLMACAVGLPLVFYGGWEMIMVGMVCVLFCFLYTISFSYIGLGDVLVLVFFGLVPVCLTFWLVAPSMPLLSLPFSVIMIAVACGVVIDTLLIVNNYRDIDNDRRTGKRTLIVRVGARCGRRLYCLCGLVAPLLNFCFTYNVSRWAAWLPLFYILLHIATYAEMKRIDKGRELNKVLGMTARNMFVYGLLVSAGFVLNSAF